MENKEEFLKALGGEEGGHISSGYWKWSCVCGDEGYAHFEHAAALALYNHRQEKHVRSQEG